MSSLSALPSNYTSALAQNDFGPLFEQYKVTYGLALEFIQDTLYDTVTYTSAATTQLSVFATGRSNAYNLGNLPANGAYPDRTGFLIMGYTFKPFFQPRSTARATSSTVQTGVTNDLSLITQSAWFQIKILDKDYAFVPLDLIPCGAGIMSMMAAEGATADPGGIIDFATQGTPDARNIYVLEEPLFLPPMVPLTASLNWPSAVTLASGNTSLRFVMHGLKVRPVQ
jgi:hypothetical protein